MNNERACFIAMLAAILGSGKDLRQTSAKELVESATRIYDEAHEANPEADTGIR